MENQSKSKIQIKINGTDISEFSAVTEGSGLLALKESVENRVFELTGKTLSKNSERKIIISEEFSNELDAAQIKVQIGNDVIISAKGGRIKDAAGFFCQNVLCEKNAKDGKLELSQKDGYVGDVFRNPTTKTSCPDPFVKYVDGYYYTVFTAFRPSRALQKPPSLHPHHR